MLRVKVEAAARKPRTVKQFEATRARTFYEWWASGAPVIASLVALQQPAFFAWLSANAAAPGR